MSKKRKQYSDEFKANVVLAAIHWEGNHVKTRSQSRAISKSIAGSGN